MKNSKKVSDKTLKQIIKPKAKPKAKAKAKEKDPVKDYKKKVTNIMEKEFEKLEKGVVKENEAKDISIPNVNGLELLSDSLEEIPKLVEPIFHRVGLAALIGSSDTGKSSLLRELCVSVVTGRKFLNWEVKPLHKRAYYVSTEDDKMAISYLLKKQNKDYKL